MNRLLTPEGKLSAAELQRLEGKVVLVKSTRDHRNPPTAMRGSIEVHENAGGVPDVRIAVDFPQMFTSRAHRRTIPLDHAALTRLLESESEGAFEYTIDDELE
jgi:hypothetical protein